MENKKSINSIEEIWRYKCSEIEKMVDQNIIRKDNIDGKTNNPKYKPIFSLLKTIGYREKFDDYEYDGKDGKDGNNAELQLIPTYEEEQSIELSM